jgi:hypothetical protein
MGLDQRVSVGVIVTAKPIDPEFDFYESGLYEDLDENLVTLAEGYDPKQDGWLFVSNHPDYKADVDISYGVDFIYKELSQEYIAQAIETFTAVHVKELQLLAQHFTDIKITYGVIVDWI